MTVLCETIGFENDWNQVRSLSNKIEMTFLVRFGTSLTGHMSKQCVE
jgi:hypothetical protein